MIVRAIVATNARTSDGRAFTAKALDELAAKTEPGAPVLIEFDPARPLGFVLSAKRTPEGVEIEAEVPDETPEGFIVPHVIVTDDARPVRSIGGVRGFALTGLPADPTLRKWVK